MAARSNPPKFRHDGNEVTPRKRIIGPGAFSHMMHSTYDPEKTANNSNITIFKILNPHINPNIPKVDPAYAASRSPRVSKDSESISQESIASSIKSSDSPLWNPCNRAPKTFGTPPPIKELSKRPTSARSEKLSQVDTASTGSSDKGSRTGRKLLIELEEELFAKTLQLQQAERVSAMVRQKVSEKKAELTKRLEELDSRKRETLAKVIAVRQSLEHIQHAQSSNPS